MSAERQAGHAGEAGETGQAGEAGRGRFGGWRRLLLALPFLHVAALVALRLWTDADDFNNWDLIGFLNANAYPSLGEVLRIPEVHFLRPFSFPGYNTGAESVLSTIVHRAMGSVSLYWSSTAVLVVHDAVFFAVLAGLLRLLFADRLVRAASWMLLAMSPVLLTFPSTMSFNMQGFATIALGLLGCESILARRSVAGVALLVLAFATISQAYPLSFFLPLFCAVWTGSRAMQRAASPRGLDRGFLEAIALAAAAVVAGVAVVEAGSGGAYLAKAFGVVADPLAHRSAGAAVDAGSWSRVLDLLHAAFLPTKALRGVQPAFAPFGVLLVLLGLAGAWLARRADDAPTSWSRLRAAVTVAAWTGLIVFGYMPAAFGMNAKSQRCYFGDLFLVLATATFLQAVLSRVAIPRRRAMAALALVLAVSDARYLWTVLSVDHTTNHEPVFDFDPVDGPVRHDLQQAIWQMKRQVERDNAALVVHYPRGISENTTDPGLFYARLLRFFGRWQERPDVLFTCRYCSPRYGCPFPEVAAKGCRKGCCWKDPVETLSRDRDLRRRRVYLWWYRDDAVPVTPARERLLGRLAPIYDARFLGAPDEGRRWDVFLLTPKKPGGKPASKPGGRPGNRPAGEPGAGRPSQVSAVPAPAAVRETGSVP